MDIAEHLAELIGLPPRSASGKAQSAPEADWLDYYDTGSTRRWKPVVEKLAAEYGVPADVALAVIEAKSGGDDQYVGKAGQYGAPQGLMGIIPAHFSNEEAANPEVNIRKGLELLSRNYQYYQNWDKALQAYGGPQDRDFVKRVKQAQRSYA